MRPHREPDWGCTQDYRRHRSVPLPAHECPPNKQDRKNADSVTRDVHSSPQVTKLVTISVTLPGCNGCYFFNESADCAGGINFNGSACRVGGKFLGDGESGAHQKSHWRCTCPPQGLLHG